MYFQKERLIIDIVLNRKKYFKPINSNGKHVYYYKGTLAW